MLVCAALAVSCFESSLGLSEAFTIQGMMHQSNAPRAELGAKCEMFRGGCTMGSENRQVPVGLCPGVSEAAAAGVST